MTETNQTICAVHQPNFFPRLSTLAKLYLADVWVVLDDVQFCARDYQHRTRLAPVGDPTTQQWLTVPVHRPHGRVSKINELSVVNRRKSKQQVAQLVRQYYGRSPHWKALSDVVDLTVAEMELSHRMSDVAVTSTVALLGLLGWRRRVVHSRDLLPRDGRSERLADLTSAVGASTYLCGRGGAKYLLTHPFDELGLAVRYMPPSGQPDAVRSVSALWAIAARGVDAVRDEVVEMTRARV